MYLMCDPRLLLPRRYSRSAIISRRNDRVAAVATAQNNVFYHPLSLNQSPLSDMIALFRYDSLRDWQARGSMFNAERAPISIDTNQRIRIREIDKRLARDSIRILSSLQRANVGTSLIYFV